MADLGLALGTRSRKIKRSGFGMANLVPIVESDGQAFDERTLFVLYQSAAQAILTGGTERPQKTEWATQTGLRVRLPPRRPVEAPAVAWDLDEVAGTTKNVSLMDLAPLEIVVTTVRHRRNSAGLIPRDRIEGAPRNHYRESKRSYIIRRPPVLDAKRPDATWT